MRSIFPLLLPFLFLGFVKGSEEVPDFTYTAVSSAKVTPNFPLKISTTLHTAKTFPVEFKFTLENEKNETLGKVSESFLELGTKVIELVPGNKLLDLEYNLTILVKSGDKVVEDRTILEKGSVINSLFVQTDKPIYKPSEVVKFRVFYLSRDFKPFSHNTSVQITVKDFQRNVIKYWENAEIAPYRGFFSGQFELSPEPNLGTWEIQAQDKEGSAVIEMFPFTVDQYVLPKFKVSITPSPTFVTFNESKVNVEVSAIYSYGKPVPGKCTIVLKEPNTYYFREGRIPSVSKTAQVVEGKGNFEFDVKNELRISKDELNKWGKTFTLFASCTDSASGHTRNETSSITMHQFPYKVEMVDRVDNILPGFPLTITLKVSTQDGMPIGDENPEALKIEHGFDFSPEGGIIKRSIPANGIVVIPFKAALNPKVCYEAIDVTYKDFKDNFWLPSKIVSPTQSYMQIKLLTPSENVREGEEIKVNVKTSRSLKNLNVIILSRGEVKKFEQLDITNSPSNDVAFNSDIIIKLPPQSTPKADLFVYTTFENGDLIADSLQLNVQTIKGTELNVSLSEAIAEPGANVSINLKGHKLSGMPSVFGVRAVDQSVLLLKKDNDLSNEKLGNVAERFRNRGNYWGGSNIFQKFVNNGLALLTNTKVDKGRANNNRIQAFTPAAMPMYSKISAESDSMSSAQGVPPQSNRFVSSSGGGGGITQAPRTRTFFPETWIWEDIESQDGQVILNKTVPDTITSWFISAFQLDPKTGLSLSSNQPQLTVFRPFFIALNLPYSIVRGEVLGLQILVHNYLEKPVNATVTLENPEQSFKFVESDAPKDQMVKTVEVAASSISSVTFPITALKFGTLNLKAKATTSDAGDAVSRPIIVKPPGIKHVQNNAVFVNLISSPTFEQKSLGAIFPDTRVKDADFLKVSVIGDILGGTLNNLDKLIKLPRGCGEQNMVNFVPDIVVLDYLKKTNALTPEIKRKAVNYLEKGYQQQLTYLRYDGSFSSFGNSDPIGSTWLTAFVTRAFVQARKYITIDDAVIYKSLRFLVRQQNDNGSFSEEGFVYDKSLVGGAGSPENQVSLTAFTLLTLVEAKKEGIQEFLNDSSIIDAGIKFILNHNSTVKQSSDPYAANLISYLLHLNDNPAKEEFFKITEDLAKIDIENGTIHWEQITRQKPQRNDTGIIKPSWRTSSFGYYGVKPATVEITSYGLLTYLLKGEGKLEDSVKIAKWLLRHRNAEGGFLSTQDTVVGITALAKFAEAVSSKEKGASTNVEVSFKNGSHTFTIDKSNKIVMQEYFLPLNTREIDIHGNGSGSAMAQLTWTYYVEETDSEPAFSLTADLKDSDKGRTLTMSICTTYTRGEKSNMAIIEANTPSGYAFDQEELEALRRSDKFKRYELEDKDSHLNLYFESIFSTKATCLELKAYRVYLVAKHSPGVVKVFDYYDNTQKADVLYKVPAISLCDICKNEPSCDIKECNN